MHLIDLYGHPLFGVTLTVSVYVGTTAVHRRFGGPHPLAVASILLVAVLGLGKIPYAKYNAGGGVISFFLGPATVALGVPFYRHARAIGRSMAPILVGVFAGTCVSIGAAGLSIWLMHGSRVVMLSMLPRGCTTPIAMEVSRQLGGERELTASFTGITGLLGGLFGPQILRLAGVRKRLAIATGLGTSAHGFGTARALRMSEAQGGVGALSMAAAGILTSIVAIPIHHWLK